MEPFLYLWRGAALDLDGPALAIGQRQDEIDLGTCGGAIEVCLRSFRSHGNQRLDDDGFPGLSRNGMTEHVVFGLETGKGIALPSCQSGGRDR